MDVDCIVQEKYDLVVDEVVDRCSSYNGLRYHTQKSKCEANSSSEEENSSECESPQKSYMAGKYMMPILFYNAKIYVAYGHS